MGTAYVCFCRTFSGLALLYPYFEGCGASAALRTTVLGFIGFSVMLGSMLVASCRQAHQHPGKHAARTLSLLADAVPGPCNTTDRPLAVGLSSKLAGADLNHKGTVVQASATMALHPP